jgi:hypothetical protein
MKIKRVMTEVVTAILVAGTPAISAPKTNTTGAPTQMVITMRPALGDNRSDGLEAADVTVLRGNTPVPVVRFERLSGDLADMQLFVLLDDSTRSSSLAIQLPELKMFLESLPATTQVAVGYMRNGTFSLVQAFTADHQEATRALRLPASIPGENGSPYFVISDLAKHWPSKQSTNRVPENPFAPNCSWVKITPGVRDMSTYAWRPLSGYSWVLMGSKTMPRSALVTG